LVREFVHPVPQVCRDLGTPDNVLYPWISQHRQAEAHGSTRAYELYVERGCREGCTLEDWLGAERDILSREFLL
jgi:transposase-like protein